MLNARKLYEDIRRAGWKPGTSIRKNRAFLELSEACGVDNLGRAIEGREAQMSIGHGADEFTIRDLFENLVVSRDGTPVGHAFVRDYLDPEDPSTSFSEVASITAVDTTAFAGVTGQLIVTKVLEPYDNEEYIVRKMIPTNNTPLKSERWIGTSPPKDPRDGDLIVGEGEPFRFSGFGEQYVDTPTTVKRGRIIGLTKEAIFYNLTGDITRQAAEVGDMLAYSEEKECLNCIIGTTVQFTEKRQIDTGPVTMDLYQEAGAGSGSGQLAYAYSTRPYNFVNDVPSNPLDDYKNVEICDQYFSVIVDPNRGRPIVVGKPFILAPHTKRINIPRVLQAENVFKISQQGINTVGSLVSQSPNPLGRIGMTIDQIAVSRLLHAQLQEQLSLTAHQADDVWFYGDIARAFVYNTNWPVTVVQAPPQSYAEFYQDVVMQWKASKKGKCVIAEPRVMIRNNYLSETSSL